jgi:hypothetical protein
VFGDIIADRAFVNAHLHVLIEPNAHVQLSTSQSDDGRSTAITPY